MIRSLMFLGMLSGMSITVAAQVPVSSSGFTPISVTIDPLLDRYSDRLTGINGQPKTGQWMDGDTVYCGWADDNQLYCTANDTSGAEDRPQGLAPGDGGLTLLGIEHRLQRNLQIFKAAPDLSSFATVNTMGSFCGLAAINCPTGWTDRDTWKTSGLFATQGCLLLSAYRLLDEPPWTGYGTVLIKSCDHGKTWCNPSHSSQCAPGKQGASESGDAIDHAAGLMWTNLKIGHFIDYCQDDTIGCSKADRSDEFDYFTATRSEDSALILARVLKSDVLRQDPKNYKFYQGKCTQEECVDGSQDAAWSDDLVKATSILDKGAYIASISYVPDLNRYVLPASDEAIYGALHPWGPWAVVASLPAHAIPLGFCNIAPSTFTELTEEPLTVKATMICTGDYVFQTEGEHENDTNLYGPTFLTVYLGPGHKALDEETPPQSEETVRESLDLQYEAFPNSFGKLKDWSGHSRDGEFESQPTYSAGEVMLPQHAAVDTPNSIISPLHPAWKDFTLFVAFKHIGPPVENETLLDSVGRASGSKGISIFRDHSNRDLYRVQVADKSSNAFAVTDGSWHLLAIRRSGSTVEIFDSWGMGQAKQIPLATMRQDQPLDGELPLLIGRRNGTPANYFSGTFSILHAYHSALSDVAMKTNAESIYASLAKRGVYLPGDRKGTTERPLDLQPAAWIAVSVRKVSSSYQGPAMEVRRVQDDSYKPIGFFADGSLDVPELMSFCGTGTCLVSKWFDQSGNGRDLVQRAAAKQPYIVVSGTLMVSGQRPAVMFKGAQTLEAERSSFLGFQWSAVLVAASERALRNAGLLTLSRAQYPCTAGVAGACILMENNGRLSMTRSGVDAGGDLPVTPGKTFVAFSILDGWNHRLFVNEMHTETASQLLNMWQVIPPLTAQRYELGGDSVEGFWSGKVSETLGWITGLDAGSRTKIGLVECEYFANACSQ